MRKIVLTLAALAAFGIALPVATSGSANAETVIIRGATHEMWAEQPDVCRARVVSFFAKH